jgi:probable HAF family extracellular repeat protein
MDINNAGQIVGIRDTGFGMPYYAYVYDLGSGQMNPLPGLGGTRSQAMAINDAGVVAGSAFTPGDAAWHAVRWTNGVPLDLGTLGGTHSFAWAVSGAGDVVGESWITGDDASHAFLYAGGSMHDLGTLGGTGSFAYGINDSGLVVGWASTASGGPHAFVHDGAAMHDLNDLIPPGSGWVLTEATAVNAQGEIAGTGLLAGERRAFLLTPGQAFFTVPPCRLVDTRNAAGPRGGPALDAGSTRTFPLAGSCEIPSNARAVSVNVAVTGPTAAGHLRAYPGKAPEPVASVVNYSAGKTRANNAVLRLGADGDLTVRCNQAAGSVQVIIDVNGYYLAAPPAGAGPTLRR